MSLDVAPELLEQATNGEVDEAAFVATVRRSLPYAYALVDRVSAAARAGDTPFADNQVPPASGRAERGWAVTGQWAPDYGEAPTT